MRRRFMRFSPERFDKRRPYGRRLGGCDLGKHRTATSVLLASRRRPPTLRPRGRPRPCEYERRF
ncbi:hypothetical protein [Lysobacter gummosus]|uniref:hypothetical protein n=1 Tax=Lysobacter gummosus TaxID=262324 RepID=UPI003642FD87